MENSLGYPIKYKNKETLFKAFKKNEYAFKFTSDELRNDKEIVLEIVKNNAFFLSFVSNTLKNDKDVVIAAMKKNYNAFDYASETLKNDKHFIIECIILFPNHFAAILKFIPIHLLTNENFITDIYIANGLKQFPDSIKTLIKEYLENMNQEYEVYL